MNEILDRKPPKPVIVNKKSIGLNHYLSQESIESDIHCEYSRDILCNYYENESSLDPNFLLKQAEMSYKHRAILIDWIHSTHKRFKLQNDTLFLAVNILDRYISMRSVRLTQIQLLGLTVLFLASKYEEIYAPELSELLKTVDSVFLKEQVVCLEKDILSSLGFYVSAPTSFKFFIRYSEIFGLAENLNSFGMYLLELSFDHKIVVFKPSVVAASAVVLTHVLFHKDIDCKFRQNIAVDNDVKNCLNEIIRVLEFARENPLKSVWDKYSKRRNHCVSSLNLL